MNNSPRTILIADDEPDIREIVSFNLEQAGYRCLQAESGAEALTLINKHHPDLVLLDIMMPGISGIEVAEQVLHQAKAPALIFMTAMGDENDILRGFELGADDYIAKPFSLQQLLARVHAVLRRYKQESAPSDTELTVGYDNLLLYPALKTAMVDNNHIALTRMEYELLLFLIQHPQTVYSRAEILRYVWPEDGLVLERTVDVTINRLRKKIGHYRQFIKAKTGYGYYWEV